jgi:mono/diheme cytochrome c family protein
VDPPVCGQIAPATGMTIAAAREAHRRAALRQRLREREVVEPGYTVRATAELVEQARIDQGLVCAEDLYETGRILFEHQFSFEDGLSAQLHRVQTDRAGGPETTSCTSCHWRGGPGGGGGLPDNAFLLGDGDLVSSADSRNPPALIGAGAVQALAAEMTADLAALRKTAIANRPSTIELVTKGVSFGTLHVDKQGNVDTSEVRGIDRDLVIKPFGWKGTTATIREFVTEAAVLHFGVQGEGADLVNPIDPLVLDAATDELTAGQLTAIGVYVAALETPVMRPHERPTDLAEPGGPAEPFLLDEWVRGRDLFEQVGCASCHRPSLPLTNPTVVIGTFEVDLSRDAEEPRLTQDDDSYPVFLFSDLKRHDLGDANASTHLQGGIATKFYLTRRLWGLAGAPPYFYDGEATTVDHAIARHGGEAAAARDAWRVLPVADSSALRIFLTSLRREPRLVVP